MSRAIRFALFASLAAAVVAGAAIAFGGGSADATSAVKLSNNSADDQRATAEQDSSALTSHDLKCSSGYYVASVEAVMESWGLYPSIKQFTLTCRNIDDKTQSERVSWPDDILYVEGAGFGATDYVRDQGCASEGGFVTGLKVDHDYYIKDLQVRCGEKVITTVGGDQKVKIDNHGYSGDWLFDRTESDDDETNLVCDQGHRVVTGLRIRYKEDSDEIAVTRMQLFCASVELK